MEAAGDDLIRAPEWAAPISTRASRAWRAVALSIGYIALYLVLDRLSFIDALHGIGITPWNPSAGLTLALLIIKGPRWSPAVMAAELLSGATLPSLTLPCLQPRSCSPPAMEAPPQS